MEFLSRLVTAHSFTFTVDVLFDGEILIGWDYILLV